MKDFKNQLVAYNDDANKVVEGSEANRIRFEAVDHASRVLKAQGIDSIILYQLESPSDPDHPLTAARYTVADHIVPQILFAVATAITIQNNPNLLETVEKEMLHAATEGQKPN